MKMTNCKNASVEGSIAVTAKGWKPLILKEGQQSILKAGKLKVSNANMATAVGLEKYHVGMMLILFNQKSQFRMNLLERPFPEHHLLSGLKSLEIAPEIKFIFGLREEKLM
ncbi:hypothetical protein FQR65_LT17948 [Abscondita terminalis]|nr:hypothetical protein FQR65_LT17948 [Abscondita terminalis]